MFATKLILKGLVFELFNFVKIDREVFGRFLTFV